MFTFAIVCTFVVMALVGIISLVSRWLRISPRELVLPKFLGRTMGMLSGVYLSLAIWTLQSDGTGLEWKVFGALVLVCLLFRFYCLGWENRKTAQAAGTGETRRCV